MARVSLELLRDPERWQRMGQLAAADARARFSQNEIVTQYEQMYKTSLAADSVT
jgi:glycosyltransferase involved in cell wall biosynthesis